MPARSVCLVTLSLSEAGSGRFGGQISVTDIYHTHHHHHHTTILIITGEMLVSKLLSSRRVSLGSPHGMR